MELVLKKDNLADISFAVTNKTINKCPAITILLAVFLVSSSGLAFRLALALVNHQIATPWKD
ncbi:hypothetical protein M433DRAFT_324698 [Acidomyces richmondensis BFW]|nr:hypothetical protein M433DRAFT_324698 [Acidomyces richmondensis BFW]